LSVRVRLLAIALLPTLVVLPVFLGWAMVRWNDKFDSLLKTKVNGDLTIAHQYFSRILEHSGEKIDALGRSAEFRDVVGQRDPEALAGLLERRRRELGLDFLYLVRGDGTVRAASPTGARPPLSRDWPIIAKAMAGTPETGVDIFDHADLAAISPGLAERAKLELIPTPNAVPSARTVEDRGMVVHTASPVDLPGVPPAALVGGLLLNQNLVFIDTINDLVYRKASLPEGSQGTATLFLEDVRVSTNVRLFENRRALGTRVSAAVRASGCLTKAGPGSTGPSWSTTGTSRPMSRSPTAAAHGSACSTSAFSKPRSGRPRSAPVAVDCGRFPGG
jgi:two-component system NtrC family sensor kinase